MRTVLTGLLAAGVAGWLLGCVSTMENANRGAQDVGRPVGGVTRLPGSVMEGAAEGVAGQPNQNPYNR